MTLNRCVAVATTIRPLPWAITWSSGARVAILFAGPPPGTAWRICAPVGVDTTQISAIVGPDLVAVVEVLDEDDTLDVDADDVAVVDEVADVAVIVLVAPPQPSNTSGAVAMATPTA